MSWIARLSSMLFLVALLAFDAGAILHSAIPDAKAADMPTAEAGAALMSDCGACGEDGADMPCDPVCISAGTLLLQSETALDPHLAPHPTSLAAGDTDLHGRVIMPARKPPRYRA